MRSGYPAIPAPITATSTSDGMAPKIRQLIAKADADIKRKHQRKIFIALVRFKSARDAKSLAFSALDDK